MSSSKVNFDKSDYSEAIAWRHDFHAHPELAYKEHRTSELVAKRLKSFGLIVETGIGGTGVVATLQGRLGEGPTIGLRTELDALPILENSGVPYSSTFEGCMHACGHDGHAAMLLDAARRLSAAPDFAGTIHFIFQPAEENGGGAKAMLDDGFMDRFACDSFWAVHNWPGLPVGTVAARAGEMTAACDNFDIVIDGVGGHAGLPHLSIDPIAAGSQFITDLYAQLARRVNVVEGGLCSVTRFDAGSAYNVVPNQARLAGTVRALYEPARVLIENMLKKQAAATELATGAKFDVNYEVCYPISYNDAAAADIALECGRALVGEENVVAGVAPTMGTEDFAYFLNEKPGCLILLGQGEGEAPAKLHTPEYDFNDNLIPIGVQYWLTLVDQLLGAKNEK
ncbi:MAG: amidohydrolase [Pseudomonadota bacterium]